MTPSQRSLEQSARPYQKRLAQAALSLAAIFSLLIGSINVVGFAAYQLAAYNFATAACSTLVLLYLRRGGSLRRACWAATALILANLAAFIWSAAGAAYSFFWITVVPPFVFFLLGRRDGTLVTLAAFGFVIWVALYRTPWDVAFAFSWGALLNMLEVMVLQVLLFRYYEKSRHDAYRALAVVSETDKLTGLFNRQRIDAEINAMCEATHSPSSLILIDIDHFKAINDTFGHMIGDQVLQGVADYLQQHSRPQDTVGRWGGEEFILVLPNTDISHAVAIAERLRLGLSTGLNLTTASESTPLPTLTVSIGVAQHQATETPSEWVSRTDDALYLSKRGGRNRTTSTATAHAGAL